MSLVGDDVIDDLENEDDVPAKVPTVHKNFEVIDEAPPIPAHTMASMELVERNDQAATGTGSRGGGGGGNGGNKAPMVEPLSSTYDVVGAVTESVYEQPEPPKCELSAVNAAVTLPCT